MHKICTRICLCTQIIHNLLIKMLIIKLVELVCLWGWPNDDRDVLGSKVQLV